MGTTVHKRNVVNKKDYYSMDLFDSIKKVETVGISEVDYVGTVRWELKFFITINKLEYVADVLIHYDLIKIMQKEHINMEVNWI